MVLYGIHKGVQNIETANENFPGHYAFSSVSTLLDGRGQVIDR